VVSPIVAILVTESEMRQLNSSRISSASWVAKKYTDWKVLKLPLRRTRLCPSCLPKGLFDAPSGAHPALPSMGDARATAIVFNTDILTG
jgi:hypothetical protein